MDGWLTGGKTQQHYQHNKLTKVWKALKAIAGATTATTFVNFLVMGGEAVIWPLKKKQYFKKQIRTNIDRHQIQSIC